MFACLGSAAGYVRLSGMLYRPVLSRLARALAIDSMWPRIHVVAPGSGTGIGHPFSGDTVAYPGGGAEQNAADLECGNSQAL